MRCRRIISIRADHPSLAGHFPGRPVVPGVVLLQEVLATVRQSLPEEWVVMGLPHVKLSSPLKPEESVTIEVEGEMSGEVIFSCRVDQRLVASGTITFSPLAAQVGGV